MNNMKCPFCCGKLEEEKVFTGKRERIFVCCDGENCPITDWGGCSKQIITELIRTRKALDVAIRAIETIKYSKKSDAINLRHKANKALIEIYKIKDQTALEQKD